MTSPAPVQLLVYRFAPGAALDGQLAGALERLDVAGALHVLDALFIRVDAETGEPELLRSSGAVRSDTVVALLDFRLDPAERRRASARALAQDGAGDARELAAALAPGEALLALLVDGPPAQTLDDAIARTGGVMLVRRSVDAGTLADVSAEVLAATSA